MLIKLIKITLLFYCLLILAIFLDSYRHSVVYGQYAIVFGNKVELNGQPSRRLKARLDAALFLYQQGHVEQVIVSGGFGKEGYDEAQVMAAYLISAGISGDRIIVDSKGYNTHQTSRSALSIIGNPSVPIVAVSQQYHLSRTRLSLHNAGFSRVYSYAPDYYEWRDIYAYAREVPAWAMYYLLDR